IIFLCSMFTYLCLFVLSFSIILRPPTSTLFPYTTLFRFLQAVAVEEDDEHVRLLRRRLPDVHRDQREGRPAGDVAALLEEQVGRSRGDRRGPRGPVRARAVRFPVYRQQGTAGRPVGPHGRGVRAALVV